MQADNQQMVASVAADEEAVSVMPWNADLDQCREIQPSLQHTSGIWNACGGLCELDRQQLQSIGNSIVLL